MRQTPVTSGTKKPVLESKIETYFKTHVKRAGGLAYKFKSAVNGVPDQIVIHDGTTHFVEIKRPGGKPRADQIRCHANINAHGVPVHVVSTEQEVDAFIRDVLGVTELAPVKKTTGTTRASSNAFL